ncbi:MAG: MATE family efflux transporter [Eubacteriales bacterium]|nr:MATE family efflux transporter [Eubacteriales bacterium]
MKKALTQEERTKQLLTEPVDKLITALAIPSVASMLITSIYNMADTYFVSQLGTQASGAVGIIFSLMAMVQAFAFMIGQGAGNNMSRALGAGKRELAEKYVAVAFFTEFFVGVVLAVFSYAFLDKLVYWLGSTDTIAPYAKDYATYICIGFPFIMSSFGLNNILRFQGNSTLGAAGMMTGGILNMVLDPLFIFGFKLGTAGAAVATTVSQMVSFIIMVYMCNTRPSSIKIRISNFKPTLNMYKRILIIGLPSLARQSIMSITTICFNRAAGPFGDACIAASSIVNKFLGLIISVVIGIGQGFQPVCAQNIGAKQSGRVIEAYRFLVKASFMVTIGFCVISLIFAGPIITAFRRDDAEVIRIGAMFLRAQAATLPLFAIIGSTNMLTQSAGYGVKATILSSLKGLLIIPFVMILPPLIGIYGLILAQPVADITATVIALIVIRGVIKNLERGIYVR